MRTVSPLCRLSKQYGCYTWLNLCCALKCPIAHISGLRYTDDFAPPVAETGCSGNDKLRWRRKSHLWAFATMYHDACGWALVCQQLDSLRPPVIGGSKDERDLSEPRFIRSRWCRPQSGLPSVRSFARPAGLIDHSRRAV